MKLFYSVEEVCEQLSIPKTTLEYYILSFKLKIKKAGRSRKFTATDIEKLRNIVDLIQNQGYTLEGAKEQLIQKFNASQKNEEVVERLKEIRKSLLLLRDGISRE